ncbi:tRNA lysidine(34) synthetase TilS [Coxiella burnetii]|uniref:tRNA(Ile)-lysidine synthase n=2 Tax=Coxiella burnetii TaxID=777 RepID=TILS_COXBU|nr:tRNA lysidine(34) synthetase TilS [Coxiella burnetii]NP_820492.1 tRNA(Ile)-lysidine synthetase [Coxiella burnetii RSA 493]Q83BJ9.1 RecName: Full=tRNA(Ile)-lysidine synthase; AltName: Full=tRNA(Ile)-2-lysyl-cytidine synthase; AltName: Full=tRNA(Ile)-lysidine synthetase [Coxiella burnetii RSA 493]AAO91006.1 tRNA(Ile)-lysidine synthetase [Coxiella burnetii RSA 493]ABS76948.1 tRNA(Ile)-lysidine synthetase [Coxiella burnetii Dugway 5J108-111]ACJ20869.1 tRNA(Ile)-lysidine synthetase [Coxiella bur
MVELWQGLGCVFTPEKLLKFITTLTSNSNFCIAYSGGIDSHVLVHAMSHLCQEHPWQLRALHINHGLNPKANDWENHCQQICNRLKIPFQSERVTLSLQPGDSIEAVARKARYAIFQQALSENETLLTAHTENDQAETFLLQLLRGAGVKGLSAMPAKRKLGKGELVRPLLAITRDDLKKYAEKNNLRWVEDDTNLELRFNRNYLRHEVLPILRRRWPEVFAVISRSANHCAEAALLLDQLAESDLQLIQKDSELEILPLLQLTPERQRNVLRRWIYLHGFQLPQTKQLEQIRNDVLLAAHDANPVFSYHTIEIRRHHGKLYLSNALSAHNATPLISWNFSRSLPLPGDLGTLIAEKKKGVGIKTTLDTSKITVRFRQGGEQCQPAGRKETHTLKKLMQEWKIPVWQRDRVPLIYLGDKLIAVVGYCICEGFEAKGEEWGWNVEVQPPK